MALEDKQKLGENKIMAIEGQTKTRRQADYGLGRTNKNSATIRSWPWKEKQNLVGNKIMALEGQA